jgi:uncharacterized protein YuzE
MKLSYDAENDVLRLRWSDAAIDESDEEEPGFIFDYGADGDVVGVEILNASQQIERLPLPQAR